MVMVLCRVTVPGVAAALLLSGCAANAPVGRGGREDTLTEQKKLQRPSYEVIVRERARKPQREDASRD